MKKHLFILISAVLMLAGCAKEPASSEVSGGEELTVTIEAGVPSAETKAVADYDGNAAKANHWIMEVRDAQGKLFYRTEKDTPEGTLTQTFSVVLLKNQTYDLLFWADNSAGVYFNTLDLTNVTLSDEAAYEANDDARDAFSACKTYKSVASEKISVDLYRPFAQLNVITKELPLLWEQAATTGAQEATYSKFEPIDIKMKVKVPTSFNVQSQTCGAVSSNEVIMTSEKSYTAYKDDNVTPQDKNNYLLHVSPATLFMDYVFASKGQKDIVDIEFSFYSNGEKVEHLFTSIPVQRNYRTNIQGNLMSNDAVWEVNIKPAWETPDTDVNVFNATVNNINSLNEVLSSDSSASAQEVSVTTTMPSDSDTEIVTFTETNNDQVVNLLFEGSLGSQQTIRFQNDGQAGTEGPANLNIVAPVGTKLEFNTPLTHVVINGESYENVSGVFSANSLIIGKGTVVNNLSISAGGLEIYGTVNNVTVEGTSSTVFVRSCEGLSETVYNALKPYISKGFTSVQNGDKWNIVAGEDWSAYAAKTYAAYDESAKTISIASAEQFALFSNDVNGGKTFEGWTIKLQNDIDMSAHLFTPVGNFTDDIMFKGTFDGQGNYIKNINVYSNNKKGVGVFGKVYAPCVLKNLNVIGATVTAEGTNTYTGGLVGHGYATILNCMFKGDIHGGNQIGGIAASGGFTITGCTFEGNIYGKYWGIGGIIGNCQDGGPISGNTAKGSITGIYDEAVPFITGGIIGCAIYTSYDVKDNYSAMNISFNGEPQTGYPVMGVYNIDAPGTGVEDFSNLLTSVAGNTWDKDIFSGNSYSIDYNTVTPTATDYFINYGGATTPLTLATLNGVNYASVQAALDAAKTGDVVNVYGTTDFTKSDDGFFYTDAANKAGRLVTLTLVNAGNASTNATFKVSTDALSATLTLQTILLGSERRLDNPGSYLKSGDILLFPAKTFFVDDRDTIYDVYGDITFLGMKGKTVMKPWQASSTSYRFFRLYNRYKQNITDSIVYNFNFKDMTFDGSCLCHSGANLFVVTCYNIRINMDSCTVVDFPGSVFSIWANDTLSDGSYPTKADNVGVEVNITGSSLTGNGRLVHYDCSPYQSRDIDAGLDRYAFIHVNYDAGSTVDNTEMYSFNPNTAKGQGNCLLNGEDVYPAGQ